jgi:tetratricopeptide (TPR) repeat protein
MFRLLAALLHLAVFLPASLALPTGAGANLTLPPNTMTALQHIYSGRLDLAVPLARQIQEQYPEHPIGYVLEAEALWWRIWCTSAEFKYGMSMARHREKLSGDQPYLNLAAKASSVAESNLSRQESAEMFLYAGMADALSARLYGLRGEIRNTARAGVRAREHFGRALRLDPELADACFGLGLYDYYVDTLSAVARLLRFFMGIPGGTKEQGIRLLHRAIGDGQLTPPLARFYLAINLENYDQRYDEALQVIAPLVEQYPENPVFLLARGDIYAKLGREQMAISSYRAATMVKIPEESCRKNVLTLVRESLNAMGASALSPDP